MKVGIVGLGLMGGSLGRALVAKTDCTVFACDRDDEAMLKGGLLKAYHEELTEKSAKELDILVLAVLPSAMEDIMERFLPLLHDGAIVTDVAGVKRPVVALMKRFAKRFPALEFVGGHPMAGREFSGVAHSTAGLYENSSVLLVPVSASLEALAALKKMYVAVGAEGVLITDAGDHDEMIAYTSQLAHVVSSAYVRSASADRHYGYSAGSFRDMTRVARMNAGMWTELMRDNADNLSREIRSMAARMTEYADALDGGDDGTLFRLLDAGNRTKLAVEKDRQKKLQNALNGDHDIKTE